MYAIIENGSHQYHVREGDRLTIDRRSDEPGTTITFDRVLLIAGGDGEPRIGAPLLEGATVTGELLRTYRGKKIVIQKFRRRKNHRRRRGHRQSHSVVLIKSISA